MITADPMDVPYVKEFRFTPEYLEKVKALIANKILSVGDNPVKRPRRVRRRRFLQHHTPEKFLEFPANGLAVGRRAR